jgi:hypothetical protein
MLRNTESAPILEVVQADMNPIAGPQPDGPDPDASAQLASLLEEARKASPQDRIAWRDRIASYDQLAIAGVTPWLSDSTLAAFAIRVICRVGEHGSPDDASRALRGARPKLSPALQGDVDWALASLKAAQKRGAAAGAVPAAARPRSS